MRSSDEAKVAQQRAFAEALDTYLRRKGWRPVDLVRALREAGLNVHQASMSQWLNGVHPPPQAVVIEMEAQLDLVPGLLSRHLGWLPLTAGPITVTDVTTAILADELLSADQRQALIATYRALLGL